MHTRYCQNTSLISAATSRPGEHSNRWYERRATEWGNRGWSTTLPEIMESKMPYYYSLTGLIYKMLCKKHSLENQGLLIRKTWIKDLL